MINKKITNRYKSFSIIIKEILDGTITGIHKSPFHGFSSEFLDYKQYVKGDNIRDIDWKLYCKTDKYYIKKYHEETNINYHFILDNSSSMHYPLVDNYLDIEDTNKFSFSVFAIACLMEIMKKQQEGIGLSIYSNEHEFYTSEKTSPKHYQLIFNKLEKNLTSKANLKDKNTDTYKVLHHIAEKLKSKTLVILFTDLMDANDKNLMDAIKHLKYKSHKIILFHTYDGDTEKDFKVGNNPSVFLDLETGEKVKIKRAKDIKDAFKERLNKIHSLTKKECEKYGIDYIPVNIKEDFHHILETYLHLKRKR